MISKESAVNFLFDQVRTMKKAPSSAPVIASGKSASEVIIASCWQEYQMLNSLMLRYLESASQVQIYAVVFLGGTVPLFQYIENIAKSGGDPYVLYLIGALIFCTLGGYQLHLDNQIAEIDNYILLHLTPRVRTIIKHLSASDQNVDLIKAAGDEIFGYHLYWRTIRYNRILGIWLSVGVIGRTGLAVISATGLLAAYIYYEYFFNPNPPKLYFGIILLLTLIVFAIIWMLTSATIIRFRYSTATQKYLEQNPNIFDYLHDKAQEIDQQKTMAKMASEKSRLSSKR
jgi:hypothetical protein